MLTSFAGPASNLILALIAVLLLKVTKMYPVISSPGLNVFLFYSVMINVGLAVFNLLPIPPLDGSKVLAFFLPARIEVAYLRLEPFGMYIIIGLMAVGLLDKIFMPIFTFVIRLFSILM